MRRSLLAAAFCFALLQGGVAHAQCSGTMVAPGTMVPATTTVTSLHYDAGFVTTTVQVTWTRQSLKNNTNYIVCVRANSTTLSGPTNIYSKPLAELLVNGFAINPSTYVQVASFAHGNQGHTLTLTLRWALDWTKDTNESYGTTLLIAAI